MMAVLMGGVKLVCFVFSIFFDIFFFVLPRYTAYNATEGLFYSGSDRVAGAIDSVVWNNVEFINQVCICVCLSLC